MAQVSVEDLLAQASALRNNIDYLQRLANDVADALASIASAKEAINALKNMSGDTLIAADKRGNLMLKLGSIDSSKVLVHLGLNYYAEVTSEKAEDILTKREQELKAALERINNELAKNVQAYNEITSILQSIEEEARRAAAQQRR
ncbi:MAG: prefoldin subunit alpha [Sulfolobales archaeon]|jgi:prefoldin alpha subunit|nr:prefoldin subunit alpha [Sulfolobales archaeon]MCG2884292.1 prefoldin subunit alpha [Sulfolobales archaeon]MCG2908683.1 prefoldin subunit alpha [Sulfolobales archaeon]MCQ4335205.1 prefoldin subunit alpha [Sulfolobales archaeon]MCQ4344444.1 prefoldin subunit alpha [Sulfolobales archaeon]